MNKRKNKSRLTKTDVNAICELQRKVDTYESYIMCLVSSIQHKFEPDYRLGIIIRDDDMAKWVNQGWQQLREIKKELCKWRDEQEKNKIPKMISKEL